MKSVLKVLVLSFVLCGAANSVLAEVTCYPGIRYNLPTGGPDGSAGWICYGANSGNCLACYEEIIVKA